MPDLYFYRDLEEEEPKEGAVEEAPVETQWGQETLPANALAPGLGGDVQATSAAAAMEALAQQTIPSWAQQVENVRLMLLLPRRSVCCSGALKCRRLRRGSGVVRQRHGEARSSSQRNMFPYHLRVASRRSSFPIGPNVLLHPGLNSWTFPPNCYSPLLVVTE